MTKTVQYDNIMKILLKIGETYGSIHNFLVWWDVRKYHVFGPYRPILMKKSNYSEIGNAGMKALMKGIKGNRKLWLIEACEDDVAFMLQQKERIAQFLQGTIGSTGKGPDQSAVDIIAKKAQMQSAIDFGKMLQTEGGLEAEIQEEENPAYFMPHRSSKHKPPIDGGSVQGRFMPVAKGGRARGRKSAGRGSISSTASASQPIPPTTMYQEAQEEVDALLKQAEEFRKKAAALTSEAQAHSQVRRDATPQKKGTEQGIPEEADTPEAQYTPEKSATQGSKPHPATPRVVDYKPNPPVVIEFGGLIQKCLGCRKAFERKKMRMIPDLIFKILAIRPFPVGKKYMDKESPAYFHLNMKCLRMHNPALQLKNVIIYDELFHRLNEDQKHQLDGVGLLQGFEEQMAN